MVPTAGEHSASWSRCALPLGCPVQYLYISKPTIPQNTERLFTSQSLMARCVTCMMCLLRSSAVMRHVIEGLVKLHVTA